MIHSPKIGPTPTIFVLVCLVAAGVASSAAQTPTGTPTRVLISSPEAVFDPARSIYALSPTAAESVWMVAFEEAADFRDKLGDWLPWAVFEVAPRHPLRWQVQKIYRKADCCYITMVFEGADGKMDAYASTWFDKGADGELHPVIANDEKGGNAFLTFTQGDGSTRRLWVRRSKDIDELSTNIRVSAAEPLWKWHEIHVKPL